MTAYDFDYFVIGAGSGGVRSSRIAATHGAKTGIAEGRFLGGTCVNVGCVPKKIFAYGADFYDLARDAAGYGWTFGEPSFDWDTLRNNKTKEIERLNGIYANLLNSAGVKTYHDYARFVDAHTIAVGNETITADKILIATGGRVHVPDIDGAEHFITSDDAFYLSALPDRIAIYGGGYIAVEFAHIFNGLGCKVDLYYRGDLFLRGFDDDIRTSLATEMERQGITLKFKNEIASLSKNTDGTITVHGKDGQTTSYGAVMAATGRKPNTTDLDLHLAGVEMDKSGRIITDTDYKTSVDHIYAVGDVTNHHNLTPVAIGEGHILADRLFGKRERAPLDYSLIATAVFSSPPIATCGLTEQQARDAGHDVAIYKSTFRPMRHILAGREEKTMMKLIVDKKTDRVLGAHMIGMDTPEIMQGVSIAMNMGATKADFDRTVGIHPTAAEEIVTMRTPQ